MLKILITGGRGQLGSELARCLDTMVTEIGAVPRCFEGATYDSVDCGTLDVSDSAAVDKWFSKYEYDLIINCAAITDVDGCESDEDLAYRVNADGARNLARAAQSQQAKILHVSTDYVFAGTDSEPRIESDAANPLSAYGRTKLAGELAVIEECPRFFVVRTAWLYGYSGNNFVKTMRSLGASHDRITVVNDQLGNPTSASDLAYEIFKIAATEEYGVYHCTNNGICSWADFSKAIMEGSGLNCEVVPVTSAQYKQINPKSANRPAFSSLRNKHLEDTIGDEMRSWQDALKCYLSNLSKLD